MLFDTHAHYDDEAFDPDRREVLAGLPQKGVGLVVDPGCTLTSSEKAVALRRSFPMYTPPWVCTRRTATTFSQSR